MFNKTFRSVVSLLLAFSLLLGVSGNAIALTANAAENDELNYVSLGDSMTNGYGLDGYDGNTGVEDYGDGSYANLFAQWLAENKGVTVNHAQLGMSAMRAEDLHWLLELDYTDADAIAITDGEWNEEAWNNKFTTGDYWTWKELCDDYRFAVAAYAIKHGGDIGKITDDEAKIVAEYFQKSVKEADIISLGMGNGNFGVFMFGRILEALGFNGEPADVLVYDVEDIINDYPALETEVRALIEELETGIDGYLGAVEGFEPATLEALKNTIIYTCVSYVVNYAGSVEAMLELNGDAEIILVALMNTFAEDKSMFDIDLEAALKGEDVNVNISVDDIGDLMDVVFTPLNAFIAALPTVMQATGNKLYANATFYYAEAAQVECLVNTYATDFNDTIRDRFVDSIVGYCDCDNDHVNFDADNYEPLGVCSDWEAGMVWSMVPMELERITLDHIKEYEALSLEEQAVYATNKPERAMAIAVYLAFEEAVLAKATAPVNLETVMGLGGLGEGTFDGIVGVLNGKPEGGYPEAVVNAAAVAIAEMANDLIEQQGGEGNITAEQVKDLYANQDDDAVIEKYAFILAGAIAGIPAETVENIYYNKFEGDDEKIYNEACVVVATKAPALIKQEYGAEVTITAETIDKLYNGNNEEALKLAYEIAVVLAEEEGLTLTAEQIASVYNDTDGSATKQVAYEIVVSVAAKEGYNLTAEQVEKIYNDDATVLYQVAFELAAQNEEINTYGFTAEDIEALYNGETNAHIMDILYAEATKADAVKDYGFTAEDIEDLNNGTVNDHVLDVLFGEATKLDEIKEYGFTAEDIEDLYNGKTNDHILEIFFGEAAKEDALKDYGFTAQDIEDLYNGKTNDHILDILFAEAAKDDAVKDYGLTAADIEALCSDDEDVAVAAAIKIIAKEIDQDAELVEALYYGKTDVVLDALFEEAAADKTSNTYGFTAEDFEALYNGKTTDHIMEILFKEAATAEMDAATIKALYEGDEDVAMDLYIDAIVDESGLSRETVEDVVLNGASAYDITFELFADETGLARDLISAIYMSGRDGAVNYYCGKYGIEPTEVETLAQTDEEVKEALDNAATLQKEISDVVDALFSARDDADETVDSMISDVQDNINDVIADLIKEVQTNTNDTINDLTPKAQDGVNDLIENAKNGMNDAIEGAIDTVKDGVKDAVDTATKTVQDGVKDASDEIVKAVKDGVKEAIDTAIKTVQDGVNEAAPELKDVVVDGVDTAVTELTDKVKPTIDDNLPTIFDLVKDSVDEAQELLKDESLYDEVKNGVDTAKDTIKDTLLPNIDNLCLLLTLPETMSGAMVEDPNLSGLLSLFARCIIGNGLGAHPSAAGHQTLANALIAAYEGEYTAGDKTAENLELAVLAVLGYLYQEGLIDDAIEANKTYFKELYNTLKPIAQSNVKETVTALKAEYQATLAELKAELADLKAELSRLDKEENKLKAQLLAERAELEKELKNLESKLAAALRGESITRSCVNTDEVVAELEEAIAETKAAIAELDAAIAYVEEQLAADKADILAAIAEIEVNIEITEEALNEVIAAAEKLVNDTIALYDAVTVLLCATGDLYDTAIGVEPEDIVNAVITIIEVLPGYVETAENAYAALTEAAAKAEAALKIICAASDDIKAIVSSILTDAENLAVIEIAKLEAIIEAAEAAYDIVDHGLADAIDIVEAGVNNTVEEMKPIIVDKVERIKATLIENERYITAGIGIALWYVNQKGYVDQAMEIKAAAIEWAKAELIELEAKLNQAEIVLNQWLTDVEGQLDAKLSELEAKLEEMKAELKAETDPELKALKEQAIAECEAAIAELKALKAEIETKIRAYIDAVKVEIDNVENALNGVIDAAELVGEDVIALIEALKNLCNAKHGLIDSIVDLVETVYEVAEDLVDYGCLITDKVIDVIEALTEFVDVAEAVVELIENTINCIINKIEDIYNWIIDLDAEEILSDLIDEYGDDILDALIDLAEKYGEEIVEVLLELAEKYGPEILDELIDLLHKYEDEILDLLEKFGEEIVETLLELIAEYGEEILDELIDLLHKYDDEILDLVKEFGEEIVEKLLELIAEYGEEILEKLLELAAEYGEEILDELIDLVVNYGEEILDKLEELAEELGLSLRDFLNELYSNACHADYTITHESAFVAIGDNMAYAELLAEHMDQLVRYPNAGYRYNDLTFLESDNIAGAADLVADNADAFAKADLVTIGYGNASWATEAVEVLMNAVDGQTYAADWSALAGEEIAPYIEEALAEVHAILQSEGVSADIASWLTMAIESYAYNAAVYATQLPKVVDDIHSINEDALVVIVGMSNPFVGTTLTLEGVTIDLGEYIDYVVTAADVHGFTYASATENTIYVSAPDAASNASGLELVTLLDLLDFVTMEIETTDNEYILEQILNSLTITVELMPGLLGDVDFDGDVDLIDANLVVSYYNEYIELTDEQLARADVDGNGEYDLLDANLIVAYYNEYIDVFPAEENFR